ncbi:hypothetical protein [Aestuariivirga sp.]|uniref:hypothetical protein n=1 Tax=Aestuariivirga sp. TaxID=2650926 RepID=UPI0039E2C4D3
MTDETSANDKLVPDNETGTADGRAPWQWETRFPAVAHRQIWLEAAYLLVCLAIFGSTTVASATYVPELFTLNVFCAQDVADQSKVVCSQFLLSKEWLACYFAGGLGGTILTIKWLIHSVGTGKWHQDRVLWRIFVPWIGGVYSTMIHGLVSSGFIGGQASGNATGIVTTVSIAFLVGLFSDGVSGLLTNVANAVFGTVIEKK